MRFRSWVAATLLVAVGLVVGAVVLAMNNPTISTTSEGEYTCLAPYDATLLGASNMRGDHTDGAVIADRCDEADHDRFVLACVLAGVGTATGLGGVVAQGRASLSVKD